MATGRERVNCNNLILKKNKRGGDGGGSGKICDVADTADVANMIVTGTGDGDLLGKRG